MNVWANVMIGFAVLVFLGILVHGRRTFNPQRARNVKYAEHHPDLVPYVVKVQKYHPEIVKTSRLDRSWHFVVLHACVLGYSISVFCGAQLTSNVLAIGDQARYTMATCFFVGSILVLIGSSLGLTVRRYTVAEQVSTHATASVLGDDIVFPYRLSMAGMGAMIVSSSIYFYTSFGNTFGSLGGWLTLAITTASIGSIVTFYRAVTTFERWDRILISEARARIADRGDQSCN